MTFMRYYLLFSLLLLFSNIAWSQDQDVVVIDGVTFSADKKVLIKYPADRVGTEYVIPEGTEVIGKKAFEDAKVCNITLPMTLTHINDSAFHGHWPGPHLVLTGKFPILGSRIFNDKNGDFVINDDNPYCYVSAEGFVYSKDDKILHWAPREIPSYGYYPWQIEIIDRYAFQDSYFYWGMVKIPSSVCLIREHAFDDINPNLPVRSSVYSYPFEFYCGALIPPELEGEVFNEDSVGNSSLCVPKGCKELYHERPQWNAFKSIVEAGSGYDGLSETSVSPLKISRTEEGIHIEVQKPLNHIRLIGLDGSIVYETVLSGSDQTTYNITYTDGFVGLLQVLYRDGSADTVKLGM